MLELNKVTKRFKGFALDEISFSISPGFIMGLIGANGAGKTTTLKLIMKMLEADSGEIILFGERISNTQYRDRIGMVMDQLFFPGEWSAREIAATMRNFYSKWNDDTFMHYIEHFELDAKKKLKDYSRGMSLKIMLAAAFSHEAELLLLDEPTSGLDAVARDELLRILQAFIKDGKHSVLFSTHITTDLEAVADYITFLDQGKGIYTGTKDELLQKYVLIKGGELPDESLCKQVKGLEIHPFGYEGLIEASLLPCFPKDTIAQKCTLDDLLVKFNHGGAV